MFDTFAAKTGRSVAEWVRLVRSEGPADPKQWQTWLKTERGLGHFQARLVVAEARR